MLRRGGQLHLLRYRTESMTEADSPRARSLQSDIELLDGLLAATCQDSLPPMLVITALLRKEEAFQPSEAETANLQQGAGKPC